jgi:hypothetical protein
MQSRSAWARLVHSVAPSVERRSLFLMVLTRIRDAVCKSALSDPGMNFLNELELTARLAVPTLDWNDGLRLK